MTINVTVHVIQSHSIVIQGVIALTCTEDGFSGQMATPHSYIASCLPRFPVSQLQYVATMRQLLWIANNINE